mgnify:CR=1 FL=1
MNKILILALFLISANSYADNQQYIQEFDQYLIYVNKLQRSNDAEVIIDANLVSETFINRLQIKARINKKSLKSL